MKIFFAFFVVILFVGEVSAQKVTGWIEVQNAVTSETVTPQIDALVERKMSERWTISLWAQSAKDYSQAYIGPTFAPKSWLSVSAQAGMETNENPWRVAGTVWMGKSKDSVLVIVEHGGSGHWHKVEYSHLFGRGVSVGFHDQAFKGRGPRAEFAKAGLKLWGSFFWGKEGKNALVGVRYSFP